MPKIWCSQVWFFLEALMKSPSLLFPPPKLLVLAGNSLVYRWVARSISVSRVFTWPYEDPGH